MSVVTILKFDSLGNAETVIKSLDGKKIDDKWFTAKPGKYSTNEIFVGYWQYEDIEDNIKKIMNEEDSYEVVSFLKQNGKTRILRRTYCFINMLTKTLEIYRGPDSKTDEIIVAMENFLNVKFVPVTLKSEDLQKICSNHSVELKQAMFKNISGLFYEILRGNYLENNEKYQQLLQTFPESLRVISFRPKIKFLNGHNKYQVTLNGDKGTIRMSSNGVFSWRPRIEIRQLVFIIVATLGLLN